ncbi:MAG TPA: malonyl-CoA decarboxylase [Geminicoccaceae bacterium]|nr:malonyl-CoA decarboxylase [Geminicoccaceae bacterium]
MPTGMVNQLWASIADAGRELLRGRAGGRRRGPAALCRDLLSTRGEASGAALAREVVEAYRSLPDADRLGFFRNLASDYSADHEKVLAAVEEYRDAPGFRTLATLRKATESPRIELFRRMNMAPNGTRALVRLRAELLALLREHGELREVDADLHGLLTSWFNPGFLSLARIDWNSPAALLEKLVRYEKVHRMRALEDLKRRLAPDRRCFAFFHPALPDEPLIFVQVALVEGLAEQVQPLLDAAAPALLPAAADTAIFYSISNCQDGLRGVNLGSFLIKLVVADLQRELPHLKTFATLSPIPGFASWLREELAGAPSRFFDADEQELLAMPGQAGWHEDAAAAERVRPVLMRLCAHYLVREKRDGRPRDPVARFHLGNGARLERINWLGDVSPKGMAESAGLLVNYRYDPATIERNHEAFVNSGEVIHSPAVRALLPKVTEPA